MPEAVTAKQHSSRVFGGTVLLWFWRLGLLTWLPIQLFGILGNSVSDQIFYNVYFWVN